MSAGQTSLHFIGGKGGVGKTTCAAAIALAEAAAGQRTLLISTDPASSLGDALNQPVTRTPRPVRGRARLHAANIDAPNVFYAPCEVSTICVSATGAISATASRSTRGTGG